MSIVGLEVIQQMAIAMLHDVDNQLVRLAQLKSSLSSGMGDYLQMMSNLDPDSPEFKIIQAKRQKLAAYEKKIDAEIQSYQNRRKKLEGQLNGVSQMLDGNIHRAYGGRR